MSHFFMKLLTRVTIEKSLVAKGLVKISKKEKDNTSQTSDESCFILKNKNIISDGVTNSTFIQATQIMQIQTNSNIKNVQQKNSYFHNTRTTKTP